MTHRSHKMAVRTVLDDHGHPVVEREVLPGEFARDIDTKKLRALRADDLGLVDTRRMRKPAFNPYDSMGAPVKAVRRRSLDDLRRLSEEIQRLRAAKSE